MLIDRELRLRIITLDVSVRSNIPLIEGEASIDFLRRVCEALDIPLQSPEKMDTMLNQIDDELIRRNQ